MPKFKNDFFSTGYIEYGYAVFNPDIGLFSGWQPLRKDMIAQHCADVGETWAERKAKGDKIVKIEITFKTYNRIKE